MIEIVFLACLGAEPTTCADRSLVLSDPSPMACVMEAQPQLALWLEDHPGWVIRRWTCQPQGASRRT